MKTFKEFGYTFEMADGMEDRASNVKCSLVDEDHMIRNIWGTAAGTKIIDCDGQNISYEILTRCAKFPVVIHTMICGEYTPLVTISKDVETKKTVYRITMFGEKDCPIDVDNANYAMSKTINLVGAGWTRWCSSTSNGEISCDSTKFRDVLETGTMVYIYNLKDLKNPKCVGKIERVTVKKRIKSYVTQTHISDPSEMCRNLEDDFEPFVGRYVQVTIEDISTDVDDC